MSMISVRKALKNFGPIVAVNGVDLEIAEGECFGLLGPNGAGKTTLVRMIIAASPIVEGEIYIDGKNIEKQPREIKSEIGFVPQEENLDPDLTVLENLMTFARYFDIPKAVAKERALANLQFFELQERHKSKIDELSGGMKRRLLIARALINRPKLIILDEPTVGLDPQTKHLLWQRIISLKEQGVTILLCTQNMEEAFRLCDRLAILFNGRVIAKDTPVELVREFGGSLIIEARPNAEKKVEVVEKLGLSGIEWQEIEGTLYIFQGDGQVLEEELKQQLSIVNQHIPTLEDVFLRLTGRSLLE
jgi:lipooligosaccharide transport system ATP-binding protein